MKKLILATLIGICSLPHCYSHDNDTSVVVIDVPPQLNFGFTKHLCYLSNGNYYSALTLETYVYKGKSWSMKLNSNLWMYDSEKHASRVLKLTSNQSISFVKNALIALSQKIDLSGECTFSFLNSDFPEWSIDWSRKSTVINLMNGVYNNHFTERFKELMQDSELLKRLYQTFQDSGFKVTNLEISHINMIENVSSDKRLNSALSKYCLQPDDVIYDCDITFSFTKIL